MRVSADIVSSTKLQLVARVTRQIDVGRGHIGNHKPHKKDSSP